MSETGQIYPQLWQFQIRGTKFSDTSANLLVASQCRETDQWHGSMLRGMEECSKLLTG